MSVAMIVAALERKDIKGKKRLALLSAANSSAKVNVASVASWVGCSDDDAYDLIEKMCRSGEFRWFEDGCYAVNLLSASEIAELEWFTPARLPGPALRRKVFARDGNTCQYCGGGGPFELDHVIPHSRGGETSLQNLVVCCRTCNRSKADRTVVEWRGGL